MSLFIASLAFEQGGEAYFGLERLGILAGPLLSGTLGFVALRVGFRGEAVVESVQDEI
jgi:NhaA family Na+:H+ antiporter